MIEEKISDSELELMEAMFDSQCFAECMFSHPDNLSYFTEEEFLKLRLYQLPFLSWEYGVFTEIPGLSDKQKMKLRENTANSYNFSGRNIGKTWCEEKLDLSAYIFFGENEEAGFSSFDHIHIKRVLEPVLKGLEHHPILHKFIASINRSPTYYILTKKGVAIIGINMNVTTGFRAGDQFYQLHLKRLWIEEGSKENDTVFEKRVDSKHSFGCIERFSGMSNFIEHSPPGRIINDRKLSKFVIRLPAYVNPDYDEEKDKEEVKRYNGKQSIGYKVFVEAEIISDGICAIDMNKVRQLCYPHKKDGNIDENNTIKNIEINKEIFGKYRALLITEKPINADRLIIASDLGEEGGVTEAIVMAQVKNKWRYLYNISLRNLTTKQQYYIFKFLYQRLNPNYMAFDVTHSRAVYHDLEDDVEINNKVLIPVCFGENIEVGYEKDNEGKPIRENGKLIKRFQNTYLWSFERLFYLLYEAILSLPMDYKLDEQLSSIIAVQRKNEISYECASRENHLLQAFQVFAITEWQVEYAGFSKPETEVKQKHDKAGV